MAATAATIVTVVKMIDMFVAAGLAYEQLAPVFQSMILQGDIKKEEMDLIIARAEVSDRSFDDLMTRIGSPG